MYISEKIKQISSLYTATILNIIFGIGISILTTRTLGSDEYGNYKFIQTVFNFVYVIVCFGIFNSFSRLLANENNKAIIREYYGLYLLIILVLGIFSVLLIYIFSHIQANVFENDLTSIFRNYSILFTLFLFSNSLIPILQGSNQIISLSILRTLPSLTFLILLFTLKNINLKVVICLFYGALAFYASLIMLYLKPNFNNLKRRFNSVKIEIKNFGLKIYFGSLFGVATASFGSILIAYFINNKTVGFFALAITISSPLMVIPTVVGIINFKSFATAKKIDNKVLGLTLLVTIVCYLCFYILVKPIVELFYGKEFLTIIYYSRVIAIGCIMHGFGDLFNRFIFAKGEGTLIRNGAVLVGIFNILGYYFLTKEIGVNGAIGTKVFSGFLYLIMMLWGYKSSLNRN